MRSNCSLKMHAFAAYCQTVTESGVKHLSFAPVCQHVLMQSHLYQLWKGGQRRSRVENQPEASQIPFRTFDAVHAHREDNFQNQRTPWVLKSLPVAKILETFTVTGKLHVLASFNPSLQAFQIYNSSEKPRLRGASVCQQAKWVKARMKSPTPSNSGHSPHSRIFDSEKTKAALFISHVLQCRHLSESFASLSEAGLGNTLLL